MEQGGGGVKKGGGGCSQVIKNNYEHEANYNDVNNKKYSQLTINQALCGVPQ